MQSFAARYFVADNRSVVAFVPTPQPQRSPLPGKPDPSTLLLGYRGQPPPVAGEAFATSIENIESRTQRLTPGNGIKLAPAQALAGADRADRGHPCVAAA